MAFEERPIGDAELVDLVERMTADHFLAFVDDFTEENAQYFEQESASGEGFKLFHTEIHQKYQRLFESRAESWLRERGCTPQALLNAVAASQAASGGGDAGLAGDVAAQLLAVGDFTYFAAMMRHRKSLQAEEAAAAPVPQAAAAAPPGVGEAALGYYPDEAGAGQWLPCVVAQIPEDGSGMVVVTWQHNGASNLIPAGHVQKAA